MPRYERSTFGCWTCRVRKKKCDEGYPICSACNIRGITCHGYGPKPDWIDGGDKEKAVVEEFKRRIKENRKHKRTASSGIGLSYTTPPSTIQDGGSDNSPAPVSSVETPPPPPLSSIRPDHFRFNPYCPLKAGADSLPSPPECGSELSKLHDSKEFDTTLLMNYLDHVFPLQFNCYTPPATELGRGWLLALLTRTKPLYHAALALSAYFMHSMLKHMDSSRTICIGIHWEEMKRHHALAFKELQLQISSLKVGGTLTSTIETVAGIFQLISFELMRGCTDSWQIHLSAAASLVPTLASHLANSSFVPSYPCAPIQGKHNDSNSVAESSSCQLLTDSQCQSSTPNITASERRPSNDAVACNFLVGTLIWFDILSSASTHKPHLLPNNTCYLATHRIQLDKIMGCENWVMILIARISTLAVWKAEQQTLGCLSLRELSSRGAEIEKQLNEGLVTNQTRIGDPILKPESPACQRLGVAPSKSNLVITRIFACSALTYLHTTISGANPSLPEVQDSVEKTISAFQMLPDCALLRNIVWPYCITGCMAGRERSEFFETGIHLVQDLGKGCPGNLTKAWDVIRECWTMREAQAQAQAQDGTTKMIDWVAAMDNLGYRMLLV